MTSSELCLCVDLGTGGPKVGVVSLDGEMIVHELRYVPTHYDERGGATQDAGLWWTLIKESATRILDDPRVQRSAVRAVAITGQYASTVPVTERGEPVDQCITWLDTRGGVYSRRAVGGSVQGYNARKLQRFIRRTGGAPSTSGADPVGQILLLMHERPEVCAATRWFMEPIDYLAMRFCGVASATHASRLAMWMTDNRDLRRFTYDETLLASVGMNSEKLPGLVAAHSVLGPVLPDVANELGLSKDAVVVSSMPDLHAAAYGSGATRPFATHLALSTTSWISCPVPAKKTDVLHSIAAVPGLDNDSYVLIDNQETGAKSLEWFQGVLATGGERMSYDDMTALAATSPPGAHGVLFAPWLAGERSPVDDKRLRGGFTNLSITTSSADMIRAVLEGVAANSAWLFGYVEKFVGQTLSPIRLVGGGAQSELWCQIFADTLDREVHQVTNPMTAQLRGAALSASVALGIRSLKELDSLETPVTVFVPETNHAETFKRRVREQSALYEREKKRTRSRSKR
ncbi:MAG TPA: FGGY-family carbohydrate kinase [Acidimicrobiales bacterium]|jgi:xylulokinase